MTMVSLEDFHGVRSFLYIYRVALLWGNDVIELHHQDPRLNCMFFLILSSRVVFLYHQRLSALNLLKLGLFFCVCSVISWLHSAIIVYIKHRIYLSGSPWTGCWPLGIKEYCLPTYSCSLSTLLTWNKSRWWIHWPLTLNWPSRQMIKNSYYINKWILFSFYDLKS